MTDAERLADEIENKLSWISNDKAAAELRRLSAINAEMVVSLEEVLAKGSRWHSCDPVVQKARKTLEKAKQ